MELDEIKVLLKSKLEESTPSVSGGQLEASIRKHAGSVTGKIKRSIWFEFAACFLCMLFSVLAWVTRPSLLIHLFCIATISFCIVFCGNLLQLYRKIMVYEGMTAPLKQSLQLIINIVTRFTRLYFRISIGLLPVIFIFGLITGYLDIAAQGLLPRFQWSRGLGVYTIVFIAWSVIIYFFSKWYIRKLYGNYLLQLRRQLKEIENG